MNKQELKTPSKAEAKESILYGYKENVGVILRILGLFVYEKKMGVLE